MAPARESPDVQGRLRALETWAQQPRTGSVDPLLLALDDPDERVRATALALLDDDWARELAAEPPAGQGYEARGER
jgi:HEAT repeat protein